MVGAQRPTIMPCFLARCYKIAIRTTNGVRVDWLLVVVLTAHLLAVNFAGAAPLVALWLDGRDVRRGNATAGAVGRWLVWQSLVGLSVGIALGLAALGLVWAIDWERFAASAGRVPVARYWYGVAELAFYFVCMGGYAALWRGGSQRPGTGRVWGRRALGLMAGTNLLYHFPPLFAVIAAYGVRPEAHGQALNFRAAMIDPEVLAHTVHFVLASFAVVGVAIMGYALVLARTEAESSGPHPRDSSEPADGSTARRADGPASSRRVAMWGAWLALVPTVLQLVAGTWVLLSMPAPIRDRLMGRDGLATALFAASLIAALVLMHRLAAVALGDVQRREIIGSMVLLALVVLLMVGTLQRARKPHRAVRAAAARVTFPSTRKCDTQRFLCQCREKPRCRTSL